MKNDILTGYNKPNSQASLMESEITYLEFEATLSTLIGKTPGSDRISYVMLKNLPMR